MSDNTSPPSLDDAETAPNCVFLDFISVAKSQSNYAAPVKDNLSSLGIRLRELRRAKNLSQTFISKALGHSKQSAYQKYESGAVTPPPDKLVMLAELLGVTTDYLLGRDNRSAVHESQARFDTADANQLNLLACELAFREITDRLTGHPRKLAEFRKVLEAFRGTL